MSASITITQHELNLVRSGYGFCEEVHHAYLKNMDPKIKLRHIYEQFEEEHFKLVNYYRYAEFDTFKTTYYRYKKKIYNKV